MFIVTFIGTSLSLYLNTPLGYISPLWLPTGISFVALLIWGRNLWPGIYFGVLTAHFYSNPEQSFLPILPFFFVAAGETIAPLIASCLADKVLGPTKRVFSEKDYFLYLLISGPLNAIISVAIGLSALLYFGVINNSKLSTYAMSWFIGQACGGMIISSLALIILHFKARNLKTLLKLTLPLAAVFTLVFAAFTWARSTQQKLQSNYARNRAETSASMMDKDLRSFTQILALIDSFLSNSNNPDRLPNFIASLDINRPGILAVSLIKTQDNSRTEFLTAEHIFEDRSAFFKNPEITKLIDDTKRNQKPLAKIIYKSIGLNPTTDNIIMVSYPTVDGMIVGFFNLEPLVESTLAFIGDPSFHIAIYGADYNQPLLADSSIHSAGDETFIPTFIWKKVVSFNNIDIVYEIKKDFNLTPTRLLTNWLILLGSLLLTFIISTLYLSLVTKFAIVNALVKDKTRYLEEANSRLKEHAQEKSAFFASISHEIRTPLNILLGTNDLLSSTELNSEQKNLLATSNKAGNTLLHLINDLLDLSKIEAGKLELHKKPFSLKTEVTECLQTFEYQLQEKGLDFELSYDPHLYDSYSGDPDRVKQVISNLLSNAIKFTDKGKIKVEVGASPSPGTNIQISVTDTGIGISLENQRKLFKPFSQADTSITRRFGGTGLGLSICKNICTMMGGEIFVESAEGQGSRFTFTLNLEKNPEPVVRRSVDEYNSAIQTQKKLSILVVDDSSDNRMLVKAYLKSTPHEIFEAENGQEAVERVKRGGIDLVLMDMQMPVMDGYSATKAIRQWEDEEHLPHHEIWALTAYAMGHEIEKTRQAGCTNHLSKPLRRKELLKNIAYYGDRIKTDETHL